MREPRPDGGVGLVDLEQVEQRVRRAIDHHDASALDLIGNGEFSLAIRWFETSQDDGGPFEGGPPVVLKRVPPFRSKTLAEEYIDLTTAYIGAVVAKGVSVVATELLTLERPDGSYVVYHAQPCLDSAGIGAEVLRRSAPDAEHPLVTAVIKAVVNVVEPRVGLDAQMANWFWDGEEAWLLDLSTPMLLDDTQMVRFDVEGFLQEYPAPLRRIVLGEFRKLVPRYAAPQGVLTDVLAMLIREGIEPWRIPVIEAARRVAGIELSWEAAQASYREDRRMFPILLRIKRAQRMWIQRRGRQFDTLLPSKSTFG